MSWDPQSVVSSNSPKHMLLDVRNTSFHANALVEADTSMTVEDVKRKISEHVRHTKCAADGWPQPHGIRCIYRGSILSNDSKLEVLQQGELQPVVIHIVVQPEAWTPYSPPELPSSSTVQHDAKNRAPPLSLSLPSSSSSSSSSSTDASSSPIPPKPTTSPLTHTPASARMSQLTHPDPCMQRLMELPRHEHKSMLLALYITYASYCTFMHKIQQTLDPSAEARLPIEVHAGDHASMLRTDAQMQTEAIKIVDSYVMQWTSLFAECDRACQNDAHTTQQHYEPVWIEGLPFLLCTNKPIPPRSVMELLSTLDKRIHALMKLYVQFYAYSVEQGTAVSSATRASSESELAHPPRQQQQQVRITYEDWMSLARYLLSLTWRIGMTVLMFFLDYVVLYPRIMGALFVAFLSIAGLFHMKRRLSERAPTEPPAPTPSAAPRATATATPSDTVQETSSSRLGPIASQEPVVHTTILELPRLPRRTPTAPVYKLEHWLQRIAWFGLEEEEVAIGFDHVSPTEPLRVTWEPCAWPPRHAQSRPSAGVRIASSVPALEYAWKLIYVCLVTFEPEIDKLRHDAIGLRKDAICSLARKWEQLHEQEPNAVESFKQNRPAILDHPYAQHLLAAEAQRTT